MLLFAAGPASTHSSADLCFAPLSASAFYEASCPVDFKLNSEDPKRHAISTGGIGRSSARDPGGEKATDEALTEIAKAASIEA